MRSLGMPVGSGVAPSGSGCHPFQVGGLPSAPPAQVANESSTLDWPLPAPVSQSLTVACSGAHPGTFFTTCSSFKGTMFRHFSQNHSSFVPGTVGMPSSQKGKSA